MESRSLIRTFLPYLRLIAAMAFTFSTVACSAANESQSEDDEALDDDGISADKDAGKKVDAGHDAGKPVVDAGHDSGAPAPKLTWTSIYDEAFAPGTPGHCGNSGCHEANQAGFECGTTAASCLSGMIAKGLISTKTPSASILGSSVSSPLRWVHTGGPMPADNRTAEPKLGADIEAWVKAGAAGITSKVDEDGEESDTSSDNAGQ